ncbi:YczI family protein [Salibacterium aidingense]
MPYTHLLLGGMFLVWGINEFQEYRKVMAAFLLLTVGIGLYVGIYTI